MATIPKIDTVVLPEDAAAGHIAPFIKIKKPKSIVKVTKAEGPWTNENINAESIAYPFTPASYDSRKPFIYPFLMLKEMALERDRIGAFRLNEDPIELGAWSCEFPHGISSLLSQTYIPAVPRSGKPVISSASDATPGLDGQVPLDVEYEECPQGAYQFGKLLDYSQVLSYASSGGDSPFTAVRLAKSTVGKFFDKTIPAYSSRGSPVEGALPFYQVIPITSRYGPSHAPGQIVGGDFPAPNDISESNVDSLGGSNWDAWGFLYSAVTGGVTTYTDTESGYSRVTKVYRATEVDDDTNRVTDHEEIETDETENTAVDGSTANYYYDIGLHYYGTSAPGDECSDPGEACYGGYYNKYARTLSWYVLNDVEQTWSATKPTQRARKEVLDGQKPSLNDIDEYINGTWEGGTDVSITAEGEYTNKHTSSVSKVTGDITWALLVKSPHIDARDVYGVMQPENGGIKDHWYVYMMVEETWSTGGREPVTGFTTSSERRSKIVEIDTNPESENTAGVIKGRLSKASLGNGLYRICLTVAAEDFADLDIIKNQSKTAIQYSNSTVFGSSNPRAGGTYTETYEMHSIRIQLSEMLFIPCRYVTGRSPPYA